MLQPLLFSLWLISTCAGLSLLFLAVMVMHYHWYRFFPVKRCMRMQVILVLSVHCQQYCVKLVDLPVECTLSAVLCQTGGLTLVNGCSGLPLLFAADSHVEKKRQENTTPLGVI